jgi:hypothetical protein
MLVGGAAGAALVSTVGARPALLIDAATYGVSLLTLLLVRLPRVGEVASQGLRAALHEAREGVRAVVDRPWVSVTMVQGTAQVLFAFAPMQVLLPVVASDRYASGAYGLLMASAQAGMLAGSVLALRLRPRRDGLTAMHALVPTALVSVCIALPVPLVVFCVAQAVAWAGIAVFIVLWFSSLQRVYPPAIQGRVFALEQLATFALQPVGLALAPAAVAAFGITAVGLTAAAALLVATYAVLLVPGVADFRDPERPGQEPGGGGPDESHDVASSVA